MLWGGPRTCISNGSSGDAAAVPVNSVWSLGHLKGVRVWMWLIHSVSECFLLLLFKLHQKSLALLRMQRNNWRVISGSEMLIRQEHIKVRKSPQGCCRGVLLTLLRVLSSWRDEKPPADPEPLPCSCPCSALGPKGG